jgi:hypothetical protein
VLGVCAAALALAQGCATLPELPWSPTPRDAKAGFYDAARLEYRVDAGKLGQPLEVLRIDGRQVNYEQIPSSPLADQSVGTLVIQQPHPAGKPGLARVTFSIDSNKAAPPKSGNPFKTAEPAAPPIGNQEEVHEVWAMDIPQVEAERYFQVLSVQNFYDGKPAENAAAELVVTMDGKETRKAWQQLPDLNGLAQRIRREGQLVAYVRPQALAGNTTTTIASVQAYREMLARNNPSPALSQPAGSLLEPQRTAQAKMPYAVK